MADVRELILVETVGAGGLTFARAVSRFKFAIRWMVVATAGTPLRFLYRAIYRLHISYALRTLRRFPGTRAVYLSRSMAKGEITIGVSDIDMVILGEWPDQEREQLGLAVRKLMALSPLYDSTLWQQIHTVAELRTLWESDYHFQSRFEQGRTQWKLAYGNTDYVKTLPEIPPDRIAGAHYMDTRLWWLYFIASTFGEGPLAQDAIFRNSICYKIVTEIGNIASALETGIVEYSRGKGLAAQIASSKGANRDFLLRLQKSAGRRHLTFDGNIQEESFQFLLPLMEQITSQVTLQPHSPTFHVDAAPEEMLLTPAAQRHANILVEHVKDQWQGFRAAYLVPSIASTFAIDDLLLLIEVDPARLPSLGQIKDLGKLHVTGRASFRQRVVLFLLLPEGAYQLEFVNFLEVWRVLVCPEANPDIFTLISRPEFRLAGESATVFRKPIWSDFANDLVNEESGVRRSAMAHAPAELPGSIEIIRNIYRHVQLDIIQRTAAGGHPVIPLTPAAIERALLSLGLPESPVLRALREAYESELNGISVDVLPLIPEIGAFLGQLADPVQTQ
jgi:hypothetical protein